MAVVFAWRGTQEAAWYSTNGSTIGKVYQRGVTTPPTITATGATGVFGGSYLAMSNGSLESAVLWPGVTNTPDSGQIAILMRIIPRWTGTPPSQDLCVMGFGSQAGNEAAIINLLMLSTGAFRMRYAGGDGSTTSNSTSTVATYTSYVSGTPLDIMMSWDGTTSANAVVWSVNGTLVGTSTAPNAWWTGLKQLRTSISIGIGTTSAVSTYDLNELVIFDNNQTAIYTPRTAFWSISAFDGSVYTDPGITHVQTGTTYTFAGVLETGTFGGGTNIDPGVNNVLSGVAYEIAGTPLTGNYVSPVIGTVQTGVLYGVSGTSLTGTYTGSDRWSDPGIANVRLGTSYEANSTTNNRTGTLIVPNPATVLSGVGTDNTVGTFVVPTSSQNASAVWEELLVSHTTVNTFGWFVKRLLTVAKFLGLK